MGYAKLNIWFRDQNGRAVFCENPVPDWNWIRIWDLGRYHPGEDHTPADHPGVGWRFQKVLSKPFENVEMKIPPGSYIVQGHYCGDFERVHNNHWSSLVFITATCGQEICVNLVIPDFATCVHQTAGVLLENQARIGMENARIAVATYLKAAEINPAVVIANFEAKKSSASKINAEARVKIYDDAIKILKQIK